MYKRKFKSRKEAYEYTVSILPTSKNKEKVLANYSTALQECPKEVLSNIDVQIVFPTLEKSYNVKLGEVPINVIKFTEDGEILI